MNRPWDARHGPGSAGEEIVEGAEAGAEEPGAAHGEKHFRMDGCIGLHGNPCFYVLCVTDSPSCFPM